MSTLTPAQIAGVSSRAGFAGSNLVIAVAVALAESGGNPEATHQNSDSHHSVDYGLFQINSYWNASYLKQGNWKDPQQNAQMAYAIYKANGWGDWVTYKTGAYMSHITTANTAVSNYGVSGSAPLPTDTTAAHWYDSPWASPGGAAGQLFGDLVPDNMSGALGALTWLWNPKNMLRALEFLAGILLLLLGLRALATGEDATQTIQIIANKGKQSYQQVKTAKASAAPKAVTPPPTPPPVKPVVIP
jgi:hypothetical protein